MAKVGLAKVGLAKVGLAKVGFDQKWRATEHNCQIVRAIQRQHNTRDYFSDDDSKQEIENTVFTGRLMRTENEQSVRKFMFSLESSMISKNDFMN